MCEAFPEVYGPNDWVHLRICISVVVRKEGGYLSQNEIIIVRNEKKDGANWTKQELTFMEQLEKVLKYFRKLEEG